MELYFFRHAVAENADGTITDYERKLTQDGINRTRHAARLLKLLNVSPTRLYSSPLVRARQTADILGNTLEIAVQIRKELAPGFNLAGLMTLTQDLGADAHLLIVGHEPDFSSTLSDLTGGSQIAMKKGGLARVDVMSYQPLSGQLIWLIAPKIFQTIG